MGLPDDIGLFSASLRPFASLRETRGGWLRSLAIAAALLGRRVRAADRRGAGTSRLRAACGPRRGRPARAADGATDGR